MRALKKYVDYYVVKHNYKYVKKQCYYLITFITFIVAFGFLVFVFANPTTPISVVLVTIPQVTDHIDRGFNLPISWQSTAAPSGGMVSLSLVKAHKWWDGGTLIADGLSTSGLYKWVIPAAGDEIFPAGYYYLRGEDITDGISYKVRATLYFPTTEQCFEGCPSSMGKAIASQDSGEFVIGRP